MKIRTTHRTTRASLAAAGLSLLAAPATHAQFMGNSPSGLPDGSPPGQPQTVTLIGVVRDFKSTHVDFGVVPPEGFGHYAGTVASTLGPDGRPHFTGSVGTQVTEFQIINKTLVPTEPYAAMVTVLGAAIQEAGVDNPVTTNATIENDLLEPFGPLDLALAGNINDDNNPRRHIPPTIYPGGTPIAISGRSWRAVQGGDPNSEDGWYVHLSFNTADDSPSVMVLRDGDPVPDKPGFEDQASIEDFIEEFIDVDSQTVTLLPNQVIYLFELGTTNPDSDAADFQDLVLLVTLGTDPAYLEQLDHYGKDVNSPTIAGGYKVINQWRDNLARPIAPHLANMNLFNMCGTTQSDAAGSEGATSFGGIDSSGSFAQWFNDVLGANISMTHPITLTRTNGVYEYLDDAFHPIDGTMYGNEGDAHNNYFTYSIEATFEYEECDDQFIEFKGGDGAWLFIDNDLVIDIGGVGSASEQFVALDRLNLNDEQTYTLRLFYAQRNSAASSFRLRTNLFPVSNDNPISVTAMYD